MFTSERLWEGSICNRLFTQRFWNLVYVSEARLLLFSLLNHAIFLFDLRMAAMRITMVFLHCSLNKYRTLILICQLYPVVHAQTKSGVNLTEDDVVVHATRIDYTCGKDNPVSSRYNQQSKPSIDTLGFINHDDIEPFLCFLLSFGTYGVYWWCPICRLSACLQTICFHLKQIVTL